MLEYTLSQPPNQVVWEVTVSAMHRNDDAAAVRLCLLL